MKNASQVLQCLARHYERRQAGRTGTGTRDVSVQFETLLKDAGAEDGDARELAERQLRELDGKCLTLEFAHKRDRSNIYQVRLSPLQEAAFFAHIGQPSPTERRQTLAQQFRCAAVDSSIPSQWRGAWEQFCHSTATGAETGGAIQPFERENLTFNAELLTLLPRLLNWKGESLVRFASCQLCDNSKRLEELAGKLGVLLEKITGGQICSIDDLGIIANPRCALLHGPIRFLLDGKWLDLTPLQGAFRISLRDIERAEQIECSAQRCLTVENETSFHELVKLGSGELIIQTSFPGSATVALLRKVPDHLQFWHFGDSDEAGFEIFKVLQQKTGRPFQSLHMYPGKIPFEQESLGLPGKEWPFYKV